MKKILFLYLIISGFISCKEKELTEAERERKLKAECLDLAKPVYVEAYKKVKTVEAYIKLAEEGSFKKQDVADQYNSTLGLSMGRLKKFEQVKIRIDTAGEAYIKTQWYKEAARIALEKAGSIDADLKNQ